MIFRIISIAFKGNQFRKDPKGFLGEEAGEFLNGLVFLPMLFPLLFIILFFILGYTNLFTGPYGFFKFIFWITFIPFLFVLFFIIKVLGILKRKSKDMINETIKVKVDVKE